MMAVNALATLLEAFFNIFLWTHTQTQRHCFTPAAHVRAVVKGGKKSNVTGLAET